MILGVLFTLFIVKRLYQNQIFKNYHISELTNDKIECALKQLNLKNIQFHELGYIQAKTKKSWFSWGEVITIIPDNEKLLINSQPTGSKFSYQPITFVKDKKNINVIIRELRKHQ